MANNKNEETVSADSQRFEASEATASEASDVPSTPSVDEAEAMSDSMADDGDHTSDDIEALKQEAQQLFDSLQRTAADLENLKKRHRKQLEEERSYGQSKILMDFADVFDDFHRALEHTRQDEGSDDVAKGIQLVHDKFASVLARYGVEAYGEVGEPFDPNIHDALHREEDPSVPKNTVTQVFQRGYRLNDRVLRPAGVVVSTGGSDA